MKKIGILTINDYNNYGNRLQNYAMQEVLKELCCEVQTIKNDTSYSILNKRPSIAKRILNLIKLSPNEIYFKIRTKISKKINLNGINDVEGHREKTFLEFTKMNIIETDFIINSKDIPNDLSDKYDYFITGSDQVWNPNFHRTSEIDFINFAPTHKRIAYSPSFGVSQLPKEHIEIYRKWISGINKLSVREDDGSKIIKDLVGRDAPVLVDPTLLLTKEKWISIAKEASNKPKSNYMLTYFLGGIPKEYKNQIKAIQNKKNLEVINIGDIREKETYVTGPSEFIDYINSCSVFCTDSFHGCVFAILMQKPFIVYERQGISMSMYSRIKTLLYKFDLESREVKNIKTNEDIFNIDYSHVAPILDIERKKAIDYLKDALNL